MSADWDEKFTIGIEEFDQQHKKLFGLINELETSVRQGNSRSVMSKVVDELLHYTLTHFSQEEKTLLENGYPDYEYHLQEHNDLLGQVREFKNNHDAGKSVITMELMGFLVNWLTNHINQTDRKYVPFLQKINK
ncbi:MAG: bacteriohemerythrin [Nitrospinota bacterium]|nr:bacteriohemerythrin [Nitrospinota bacterium]MDH5678545.1 bacteriohemerythrin [Nitrospinota bacterium]MDH5755526.1 bacteriohemerythrin [Nitrospinota bacterium]